MTELNAPATSCHHMLRDADAELVRSPIEVLIQIAGAG